MFQPVRSELNLPIAAFVFIAILSAFNSVSFALSFRGFFFKLVEGVALYFITIEAVSDERALNNILRVLLFSMALTAADGIFQLITGTDFIRHFYAGRMMQGPFHNPNGFSGWLLIMVFLAFGLARSGKNNRPAMWFLTGLLVICLVLTYSRGAWTAAALALIFMAILKDRKVFVITTVIALILCFIIPCYIKGASSWAMRSCLWREALQIIEDFPLLGTGINTYANIGPHYAIVGGGGSYPHNCYLQMAAETGLLGVGAFVWVIFALFKTSLANLKIIKDPFYKTLLTGMLAGLFGFLAHSFVDTDIYTLQLVNLMWVMIGLIVAAQKIALQKRCFT
jgi:putative inorganic carbon (HCO3(-)) transporter